MGETALAEDGTATAFYARSCRFTNQDGTSSRVTRIATLAASSLLLLTACSDDPDEQETAEVSPIVVDCVPADSTAAQRGAVGEVARATELAIYIDGSQSMSGFNAGRTRELRPLGDLLNIIAARGSEYNTTSYFAFGRNIQEVSSETAQTYGTTGPYNCAAGRCDNQESRLDNVLREAASAGQSTLSVIISDLWLDNKAFSGSPQVALGQPLQQALQNGLAIGVIGIKSPFSGAVYDVPGVGTYRGATELPLYVLAIGPEEDVATLYTTLTQSGSPAFASDRTEYSLFSSEDNNPVSIPDFIAVGVGAEAANVLSDGLLATTPQYRLDLGIAESQNGQLGRTFDIDTNLRPGLVWQGQLNGTTTAWRLTDEDGLSECRPGTWQRVDELNGLWQPRPNEPEKVTFSFGSALGRQLRPDNVYYLEARLGSGPPTSPNDATQWMRDWSLGSENAEVLASEAATSFKTLNLADLSAILEQELSRQTSEGRQAISFGFILQVER